VRPASTATTVAEAPSPAEPRRGATDQNVSTRTAPARRAVPRLSDAPCGGRGPRGRHDSTALAAARDIEPSVAGRPSRLRRTRAVRHHPASIETSSAACSTPTGRAIRRERGCGAP
jgi:hypothetical protein